MADSPRYPNLVERALGYLRESGTADEAELCAHLFGARPGQAGPWARLLASVLRADRRFEALPDGRWGLRGQRKPASGLAELELVALAIQATGPKPWRGRLVGLAALRTAVSPRSGERVLARFRGVVRPDRAGQLPSYLSDFSAEEVEAAPTFAELAPSLLAFLGDLPILGLDVGLAVAFLQFELRRLGLPPLNNRLLELSTLGEVVLGAAAPIGKPGLERLGRALGLEVTDRDLDGRARATAAIGQQLLRRAAAGRFASLADLGAALAARSGPADGLAATRQRLLLDAAAGRELPSEPGVYLMRDREERVLYVGKATSLRQRLASYFNSDLARSRNMPGLVEATARLELRPTETELEARLLEARLIAVERPGFNVQARSGVELVYLRRNAEAASARVKGAPRRPGRASPTEVWDDGFLGPLAATEARRLLDEVGGCHRLVGARRDRAWVARADEAWASLASEAADTPVGGGLAAHDLTLFGLLAPWPSPPPAEPPEEPNDGPAGLDDSDDWFDQTPCWSEPERRLDAEEPPPEDEEPRETRLVRDGRVRLLVFGQSGWLGSLTLAADAARDEAALEAARLAEAAPGPTALAELGVALHWAARWPATVVRLEPPLSEAAALLPLLPQS